MTSTAVAGGRAPDLVCCRVAGATYAFDSADVRFISRSDQVVRDGDGVARVGTLRGRDRIPVYSMAALLHPSTEVEGGAHVVVTGSGDDRAGWQVERLLTARRGRAGQRLHLPALAGPVARRWFSALLEQPDDSPALVCSPAGLDPRARDCPALPDPPVAADALPPVAGGHGIVAIFSSAALPHFGATRYAIAGRRVVAILPSLPPRAVPGTPSCVLALAAWRGLAIPVLDLNRGATAAADAARTRYLIVRYGSGAHATVVAIPIERGIVLHKATQADALVGRPPGAPAGVQLFAVNGETVAFVDLDSLVGQSLP